MSNLKTLENLTEGDFVFVDEVIVRLGKDWDSINKNNYTLLYGYGWRVHDLNESYNYVINNFSIGIKLLLNTIIDYKHIHQLYEPHILKSIINEYFEYLISLT